MLSTGCLACVNRHEQTGVARANFKQGASHAIQQTAGCIDHDCIDSIGTGQCFEYRADEIGVVDNVAGDINRVGHHAVIGDAVTQGLLCIIR
ncbi:hypothetical protein D3C78_1304110 [compost metagenome]